MTLRPLAPDSLTACFATSANAAGYRSFGAALTRSRVAFTAAATTVARSTAAFAAALRAFAARISTVAGGRLPADVAASPVR